MDCKEAVEFIQRIARIKAVHFFDVQMERPEDTAPVIAAATALDLEAKCAEDGITVRVFKPVVRARDTN